MIEKVFLDANILIDIFDDARRYHEVSYKSVEYLINHEIDIYTSSDIITTVYYVLKKQSINVLGHIKQISLICGLIGFTNNELDDAIILLENNKMFSDLEDTIQYLLAKKLNCDLILTNDDSFPKFEIKTMTSEDFNKKIIQKS